MTGGFAPLPRDIWHKGRRYKLRLTAANVLRYMRLCDDSEGLTAEEVVEIGFSWIVKGHRRLSVELKSEILGRIFSEYVVLPRRKLSGRDNNSPVVDFYHDSDYIFASFMATYGIDLYKAAPKMHWHKFAVLFDDLPEDSKIKQIMDIRAREIPKPNQYNYKEIQRLSELKALYALPDTGTEDGDPWGRLFDMLERQVR